MDYAAVVLLEIIYMIAFLALTSAGLAVVFGMMRVINLAHGEFVMIGGYTTIACAKAGINVYFAMLVVSPLVVGILGLLVERLVVRQLYGRMIDTMLATWGLSLLMVGIVTFIFGNTAVSVPAPIPGYELGEFQMGGYNLFIIGIATLLILCMWLVMRFTRLGLVARGAMQSADVASSLGYDPKRVYMWTFTVGAALSGLAGGVLAPLTGLLPSSGGAYIAKAFITVITGGAAVITGTLSSSVIFGTINQVVSFGSTPVIGEIVMFMNFAGLLVGKLESTVTFANWLFMLAPKLREFFDVLDAQPGVRDGPGARDIGKLTGRVAFENVTFSYDGRRNAVKDVSFVVEPGQTVALVGATGSGKSTTLGLLHRVFDPNGGRVAIDGIDIRDMTLTSLRANIGVVFQEPMLFARSIEENLRIGKPDASDAEIALALERAQASDFVARQSDGLATIVGERGRTLSGGERQRVSIARALLKDPPILIFDEATSALDATTERLLQKALEAATQGRTTFVIAHRLATIRNADRIFVFDQGQVVETGSFEELVALNGRFAELARAQFMAEAVAKDGIAPAQ